MIQPTAGALLIAEPFLKDPNFSRTVVFLCDHQEAGSFGFVLNRKFDYFLHELIETDVYPEIPIYNGGPVQQDTIHFLHTCPELIPDSQQVYGDIYWGGNFEVALELVQTNQIDLSQIRFFLGYSGWAAGQLTDELKEHSWLTAMSNRKIIFQEDSEQVWKDSLKLLGGDYERMANYPIDPQLN